PAASAWLGGAPVKTFLPQEALHPRQPQFSFGFEREGRFFEGVASPVPRGGGVIALRDVTERHRLMERLAYQATHDDLTGLYNRRALLEHLRSFPGGAMAFLDVDGFASLNESLGDEAGDALLHMVAAFLEAKADGFVARAGGDEFAWLLEGVSLQEALERVHQLVEGARRLRFSWKGRLYPVSLSAGVVAFSKGLPEEEMLGASEHCLMLAKNMGWGSVKGCSLADPAFSEVKAHFDAFRRLDRAIREHQLILFAQPIIPLHGEEKGAHYEILLRVKDEAGRIVPPGGYLEAAKRFRLLTQVDRFVLNMVADFLSALQAHGEVVCSVNLSGASVGDENTLSFIQQLIDT
ncbi:MAG: diguanylate cyclase, partial [Gammaproteobacteria bacterium]